MRSSAGSGPSLRQQRERTFWEWAYRKVNPKRSGSGIIRRGVMVPRLDKKKPRPAPSGPRQHRPWRA